MAYSIYCFLGRSLLNPPSPCLSLFFPKSIHPFSLYAQTIQSSILHLLWDIHNLVVPLIISRSTNPFILIQASNMIKNKKHKQGEWILMSILVMSFIHLSISFSACVFLSWGYLLSICPHRSTLVHCILFYSIRILTYSSSFPIWPIFCIQFIIRGYIRVQILRKPTSYLRTV